MTFLAVLVGNSASASDADPRSPGTVAMIERLKEIDARMDIRLNSYESERRAKLYGELAAGEKDPDVKLDLMRQHAIEALNAGHSLEAVSLFGEIEKAESKVASPSAENLRSTQILKATSWLRVGEQENCISNHTTESCLLPIRGNGVHRMKEGSTEAMKILEEVLEKDPYRLDARWLLNVASMTLGKYPQEVPPRWLVPPERFESDYDIKRFTDIAGGLGIDLNELSGGTVIDDFNNDGLLDLMVSSYALNEQMHLFLNNGNGTFSDRTREAGLEGLTGGLNMVQGDYDNDGNVDVLVLRGAWLGRMGRIPNSLLHNNGDGTFSD
ncbi:CRTAC1 family protein, partial [bacterium]|nr:CRTAC1 family protein [bacterium]